METDPLARARAVGASTGAGLTVLSGPSGVGKGSVVAVLSRAHPSVWLSVSVTTRPPRPGEQDGVHYHFVGNAEFDRMIAEGELLEWADYTDRRYGTPRRPVIERLAAGVPVLLEIELRGARQVKRAMPGARFVFLKPPSWAELQRRLVGRGTEPPAVIAARLARGREEMAAEAEFDHTIVNRVGEVEAATTELIKLIESGSIER